MPDEIIVTFRIESDYELFAAVPPGATRSTLRNAMHGQQSGHARRGKLRVVQYARLVGKPKQLGEMDERARALLPADHDEMVLQPVEPGEEDDPGLVEAGRRPEDVARQRHGRLENAVEALDVARRQPCKAERGGRRDRVEDAEQGVRMALLVAGDQLRVVEIVARIHAHAGR